MNDSFDILIRVLSGLVAAAGVVYVARGLKAWDRLDGREEVRQGVLLALIIGSNALPDDFESVREIMVVVGCLLTLYMIAFHRRIAETP